MRDVTQAEVLENFPALLEEAQKHALIICRDGQEVGALISMEDMQIVRAAYAERLARTSERIYAQIESNAERYGERVEDVVEELLRRD